MNLKLLNQCSSEALTAGTSHTRRTSRAPRHLQPDAPLRAARGKLSPFRSLVLRICSLLYISSVVTGKMSVS